MSDQNSQDGRSLTRSEEINIRISVLQTILALVGIFIGSIALYAALGESEAVRKQTEASVWPRLSIDTIYYGHEGEERVQLIARNRGIGPAIVNSVEVTLDGEPKDRWYTVINSLMPDQDFRINNRGIDRIVLSPNEDATMLMVEERYSSNALTRAIREAILDERLVIDVCYCSVFDSCWRVSTTNPAPEEAKQCEEGPVSNF